MIYFTFFLILILFTRSFLKTKYLLNYEFYYLGTLVAYYIIPVLFLFLIGGAENTPLTRIRKHWFDSILDDYWWQGLLVIIVAFLLSKKWKLLPKLDHKNIKIPLEWVILALIISLVQSIQIFNVETHGDSFAIIAELPLLVRQLLKLLNFIVVPMWILLSIHSVNKRSLFWYLIIVFIILLNFTPYGSRGQTVFQILIFLIVYSSKNGMPNRIKFSFFAFFGFIVFMFLGFFRAEVVGSSTLLIELLLSGDLPFFLGELDQIFANAVEIFNYNNLGVLDIPSNVRLTEQLAIIPSQFLPFEKLSYSDWYLAEFYPAYQAEGGGWAFGTMALIATFDSYIIPFLYLIEMWFLIYILFYKAMLFFPVWFRYPLQIFIFANLILIHRSTPLITIWSTFQALVVMYALITLMKIIKKNKPPLTSKKVYNLNDNK